MRFWQKIVKFGNYREYLSYHSKINLQIDIIENRKNKKIALEEEKQRLAEEEENMEDEDIEEVDSDEWDEEEEDDPIPRTDCFFCLHHSATLEKNAIHMSNEHSFFIPDVEYLVDLAGLFEYIGAKVSF